MRVFAVIVLVALAAFWLGRLSVTPPPVPLAASCPTLTCPPPTTITRTVRTPSPPASRPVAAPLPIAPDSAAIATSLRGCVGEQRAYAGTTLVLRLVTDAAGKVTLADLQGADFLSEPERRCVKSRARTWTVAAAAEEILIHVSL